MGWQGREREEALRVGRAQWRGRKGLAGERQAKDIYLQAKVNREGRIRCALRVCAASGEDGIWSRGGVGARCGDKRGERQSIDRTAALQLGWAV